MLFEKNVRIPTAGNARVMAIVFRPAQEGRFPVLMSIYGKAVLRRGAVPMLKIQSRRPPRGPVRFRAGPNGEIS